jgi:hypothetical protein
MRSILILDSGFQGVCATFALNKKTAIETVVDEEKLTPTQQQMLETGDYGGLAEDIQENATPDQIDCAVQAVGEQRAREIAEMRNPTPQEIMKLSGCL